MFHIKMLSYIQAQIPRFSGSSQNTTSAPFSIIEIEMEHISESHILKRQI